MPQPDFCPITARGVFPRLTADMSLTIEPDDPKAAMLTPPWLTVSTRIELFWDRDYRAPTAIHCTRIFEMAMSLRL